LSKIIEVAVNVPLRQTFDYLCNEPVSIGSRVWVSFGRKKVVGIVLAKKKESEFSKLKEIESIIDADRLISSRKLKFLKWISAYYHHPIGEVILGALPKNLRLGEEAIAKKESSLVFNDKNHSLTTPNNEQQLAIDSVLNKLDEFHSYLLHGITGSGKTEVYLHIAREVIKQGKQVLVLVPEIGLTPQMIDRFSTSLECKIAIHHSRLNETQKNDAYLFSKTGEARVLLGTRSAAFAQLPELGLIIVDEEHDSSFKQQSALRYSARDISIYRAKTENIPIILGTATPSLETIKNVMDEKIHRLTLGKRPDGAMLPKNTLVNTQNLFDSALSPELVVKIQQHLSNQKQVMLFINRRGYSPIYSCFNCNWKASCIKCDSPYVYHRGINRLRCHHCSDEKMPDLYCPECGSKSLQIFGYGTERLEETLESHFKDVEIIRIDRDTTTKKKDFEKYLEKIQSGQPCIIIGTQMLAKGHDFPNLTLVGILDIDLGLISIDYRAIEKLAQLLIQVSGRSGRAESPGEVVVQTRLPDHPIFSHILKNKYMSYANLLIKERETAGLPPFSYQAIIGANSKEAKFSEEFLNEVKNLFEKFKLENLTIWGPAPGGIAKKNNRFYFNLHIQSQDREELHKSLKSFINNLNHIKINTRVRWTLDVDPIEY
jgi:primosomal protein N' (replication factor Y)